MNWVGIVVIKSQKLKLFKLFVFLMLQAVLFVLVFVTQGLFNRLVSFLSIVNCLIFAITFLTKDRINILTQLALLFTVLADVFLVLIDHQIRTLAMTFFSMVQICYFLRLLCGSRKKILWIIVYSSMVVLVEIVTIIVLKGLIDYLSIVSIFYYTLLICNVVFSFFQFRICPLFAIGLLLFLFCDTLIGLNVAIGTYISLEPSSILYIISHTTFNFAWLFYVPAQTLLALSISLTKKQFT